MTLTKQKGRKIGVFGLGVTGVSAYKSLHEVAAELLCYDDSEVNREDFIDRFGGSGLRPLDDENWTKLDKIVVSPGVPHSHPVFQLALENGIAITSDIELFIEENPDSEFIFITGTNGKSTVTSLVGHILASAGLDYHIGGNIGTAVLSLPYARQGYIFELSSFHIELLKKIDPEISVITNITPDHLDRHGTVEEYAKIKSRILTPDALKIIGINSLVSRNIYHNLKNTHGSKMIPVSNQEEIKNGVICTNKYLYDKFFDQCTYPVPVLSSLQGASGQENIGLAYAVCRALGVGGTFIMDALGSFKGLAHRMQYIGSYKNLSFYNDSKATNISSSLASLSAFEDIIWFAGGRFKETSLEPLTAILKNVKKAYFFGESKNLFGEFLRSCPGIRPEYEICLNLEEAFTRAMEYSARETSNLTFLLAPACASYDQFKNFEERGQLFIELARPYLSPEE